MKKIPFSFSGKTRFVSQHTDQLKSTLQAQVFALTLRLIEFGRIFLQAGIPDDFSPVQFWLPAENKMAVWVSSKEFLNF